MACRLCLTVFDNTSEYTLLCEENGFSEEYLLILKVLPGVDLSLSTKPLVCATCSATLRNLDDFKQKCVETEDRITEYKNRFITQDFDIKKFAAYYRNGRFSENNVQSDVCRICLCYVEQNEGVDLVKDFSCMKYFTECIHEAVIEKGSKLCQQCAKSSESLYGFYQIYMETEYFIKQKFQENQGSKLGDEEIIAIAKDKQQGSLKFTQVKVKQEPQEYVEKEGVLTECDSQIKMEDEIKMELENINSMISNSLSQANTSKKHFCSICFTGYKAKHNLIVHIRNQHNGNVDLPLYFCPDCDFNAIRKHAVKRHIERHHGQNNILYKCTICKYTTYIETNLKQHIYCRHKKDRKRKLYYCSYCEFNTYYTDSLKKHMRVQHIKGDLHKCKICGFETFYKNHLNTHIETKHQQNTLLKCEHCEYTTYSKVAFQSHVKFKHIKPDNTLRKCELCTFETRCRKSYSDHMRRMHWKSLKKTFNCDLCEYETGLKSALAEHRERVHSELYEKLKCPMCSYKTTVKKDFAAHKRLRHKDKANIVEVKVKSEILKNEEDTKPQVTVKREEKGEMKVKLEPTEVKQEV